jgi:hypothetical protein
LLTLQEEQVKEEDSMGALCLFGAWRATLGFSARAVFVYSAFHFSGG